MSCHQCKNLAGYCEACMSQGTIPIARAPASEKVSQKLLEVICQVRELIEPLSVAEVGVVAIDVLRAQGAKAGISMEVMAWALAENLRRKQN
jgi:hypothetical protein